MIRLLCLLAWPLVVLGAEPPAEVGPATVHLGASTAFEGLPDSSGEARARLRQSLLLDARFDEHADLVIVGQLRPGGAGPPVIESDLLRVRLRLRVRGSVGELGRLTRMGSLGRQRIDGLTWTFGEERPNSLTVWGGRLSSWDMLTGMPVGLFGAELRLRPIRHGIDRRGERLVGLDVRTGAELRFDPDGFRPRFYGTLGWVGTRGTRLSAIFVGGARSAATADGGPEGGFRVLIDGSAQWGRLVDLGLALAWHDLPPDAVPESTTEFVQSLAPEGYGRAEGRLRIGSREVGVRLEGGATVRPLDAGPQVGGRVRLGFDAGSGPLLFSVFGTWADIGPSYYGGGGFGIAGETGRLRLKGEGAIFEFAGLDGRGGIVGEGRLKAELSLPTPRIGESRGDLRLVAEAAGGADRLLAPWIRAGVGLRAEVWGPGPSRRVR